MEVSKIFLVNIKIFLLAKVIPREVVFYDTKDNRFIRPCDVKGFETLPMDVKRTPYRAVTKVINVKLFSFIMHC